MKQLNFIVLLVIVSACDKSQENSDAYGNFEATKIMVAAETPGKILQLPFEEGDQVRKNQIIGLIDTTQLYLQKGLIVASMQALESKLQNVPIQLNVLRNRESVLQKEIDRFSKLVKQGAATQKQLDDLTGELAIIQSQLAATESQLSTVNRGILAELKPLDWKLRAINDQLSRCTIISPIDGVLLEKFREPGEIISQGQPLCQIANLNEMELRVYVSGDQLSEMKIGKSAEVIIDGADGKATTMIGKITWVSSEAEFTPKSVQTKEERVNLVYAIKLIVPNDDGSLKIGMPAEVNFLP